MTNFNWIDYVILGILFASILAGLLRGLIKEIFSLLTWIAAFVISSMYTTKVASTFSHHASPEQTVDAAKQSISLIALGVSFIGIFIAVLLAGSLISYIITRAVEGPGISFVNRFLGALFGLGRGVLLILFIMFLVELTPLENQNEWKQSQFVDYFKPVIKRLDDIVQPGMEKLKAQLGETAKEVSAKFKEQEIVWNLKNI